MGCVSVWPSNSGRWLDARIRKWCRPVSSGCREPVADDDQGAGRPMDHGVAADLEAARNGPYRKLSVGTLGVRGDDCGRSPVPYEVLVL